MFLFIGIIRGWISLWMLTAAGVRWGIVRYVLAGAQTLRIKCVSGDEAFYTFLYLTRDTFFAVGESGAAVANYHNIYRFFGGWLSCVILSLFPHTVAGRDDPVLC